MTNFKRNDIDMIYNYCYDLCILRIDQIIIYKIESDYDFIGHYGNELVYFRMDQFPSFLLFD